MLGTNFDVQLSKEGYNYVSDLRYTNEQVQCKTTLDTIMNAKLANLRNKLDHKIRDMLMENINKVSIIYPFQTIRFRNEDWILSKMDTKHLYQVLIGDRVRIPIGLLHWCMELELSDHQIKTALTFVSKCSQSMQDRAFQYKIITNILPTNEYLKRYKVRDSDQCDLCNMECDTITHRLYECVQINIWVEQIFSILQTMCSQPKISMVEYLFGKSGQEHVALNHILVELKKMLFYFS